MASIPYLIGSFLGGMLFVLIAYTPYYLYKRRHGQTTYFTTNLKTGMIIFGILNMIAVLFGPG
jgi:hypothetical protein